MTDRVTRELGRVARNMSLNISKALNDAAFATRAAEQGEMRRVFDRPTPFVLNQVFVQKSTAKNLVAQVGHTDRQGASPTRWDRTLSPHIEGGDRRLKGSEQWLRAKGMLPAGWFAVPGSGMPLNAYGNPKPSEYSKLLSWVRAYSGRASRINRGRRRNTTSRAGAAYFPVYVGSRIKAGIYKRASNGSVVPILFFVPSVSYSQRLPFRAVANRTINPEFDRAFRAYLAADLR